MAEQEDFDNILKQHRGGDPVDTAEEEYKGVVKKQRIKASNDKYVHGKLRKEKQKVRNRQRKLEEEEKNRGEDEDIPVLEREVVEEEERKSGGSSTNDTTSKSSSKSSSKSKGKSKDKSTDEDEDEVERPSIPYHKIIPGLTSLGTNGPHSRVVTAIVLMIVILGLFLTIVPITVVGIGRTTRGNLAAMAVGGGVTIS